MKYYKHYILVFQLQICNFRNLRMVINIFIFYFEIMTSFSKVYWWECLFFLLQCANKIWPRVKYVLFHNILKSHSSDQLFEHYGLWLPSTKSTYRYWHFKTFSSSRTYIAVYELYICQLGGKWCLSIANYMAISFTCLHVLLVFSKEISCNLVAVIIVFM